MPVVPFIPAIIAGGATIFGAHEQASGNTDAAKTQADAANRALDVQQHIFDQKRQDLSPYRLIGSGSVGRLSDLWGFPSQQHPQITRYPDGNVSIPVDQIAPGGTTISNVTPGMGRRPALPPAAAPQVGEVRLINGQQGRWDGTGWEAM